MSTQLNQMEDSIAQLRKANAIISHDNSLLLQLRSIEPDGETSRAVSSRYLMSLTISSHLHDKLIPKQFVIDRLQEDYLVTSLYKLSVIFNGKPNRMKIALNLLVYQCHIGIIDVCYFYLS